MPLTRIFKNKNLFIVTQQRLLVRAKSEKIPFSGRISYHPVSSTTNFLEFFIFCPLISQAFNHIKKQQKLDTNGEAENAKISFDF